VRRRSLRSPCPIMSRRLPKEAMAPSP
jgi:hypothetical protein